MFQIKIDYQAEMAQSAEHTTAARMVPGSSLGHSPSPPTATTWVVFKSKPIAWSSEMQCNGQHARSRLGRIGLSPFS